MTTRKTHVKTRAIQSIVFSQYATGGQSVMITRDNPESERRYIVDNRHRDIANKIAKISRQRQAFWSAFSGKSSLAIVWNYT